MANDYGVNQDAWHPNNQTEIRYGAIRLLSTGPEILHDASHVSVGLVSVSIDSAGYLVVQHDGSLPVGAVIYGPDETLAGRGVIPGASEGGLVSKIKVYRIGTGLLNLNNPAHYALVAGPTCNLWVISVMPGHRGNGDEELTPEQEAIVILQGQVADLTARVEALEV